MYGVRTYHTEVGIVLDSSQINDASDSLSGQNTGISHAGNEAYTLLAQQSGPATKAPEKASSGAIDFGHPSDLYKDNAAATAAFDPGRDPNAEGPNRRNYADMPKSAGVGTKTDFVSFGEPGITSNVFQGTTSLLDTKNIAVARHVTVGKDETVSDFAKGFLGKGASADVVAKFVADLAKVNGLDASSALAAGKSLVVPDTHRRGGPTQTGQGEAYPVQPGDSLWTIAKAHLPKGASNTDILKSVYEIQKASGMHTIHDTIMPGDVLTIPGDKQHKPKDNPQHQDNHKFDSPEKQQLIKDAEEKFKNQPEKLAQFKANMKDFEGRADHDKLAPEEVAKTYKEVDRLLESKGDQPLKPEQRQRLAEQVMNQAAHPYSIDQGDHNTCNVNTTEVRTYVRKPSEAAKLVSDVATTGSYTTKDGLTVKIDAQPHRESKKPVLADGDRSHASEIFQVTAANIRLEQDNQKTNPPGKMRYEQTEPVKGSIKPEERGEAIWDYSTNPRKFIDDYPGFTTANDGRLRDIYASITGIHETGTVIGSDTRVSDKSDGVKRIHTEQELNDYLAQCKKENKFPIAVSVNTTAEPFWTDSGNGSAGGSGGGHLLNITDYEPGPPGKVTLDNSWGSRYDYDARSPISTHDLLMAMESDAKRLADMKGDADYDRAHGQPNHWKEVEVARLQRCLDADDPKHPEAIKAKDDLYEQNLLAAMRRAKEEWAKHPDPADRERTMKKLNDVIQSLPPENRKRLKDEEKRLGLS